MDFSDERYVRLFTRDTTTWKLLKWEGQTLFMHLLRKVDRAGLFEFGDELEPVDAIVAVTELPAELVTVGLKRLLERGTACQHDRGLLFPRFIEAQESHPNDAQRQREARARRRDKAAANQTKFLWNEGDVTKRDSVNRGGPKRVENEPSAVGAEPPEVSQVVTLGSKTGHDVTPGFTTVTPICAVPSDPDLSNLPTTAKDLTGRGAKEPPLQRSSDRPSEVIPKSPEPAPEAPQRIPCPLDLWERMPQRTKEALDVSMIPRFAQEKICREFTARYAGRMDDERREDQWVASVVRAISADWNDLNRRPKPPDPNPPQKQQYKLRRIR